MELTTVWFVLIAVLWTGYFFLEGFDFGVGMLLPVLGRDDDRAPGPDQHHRPGLGRQRGVADRRRRRHVRRVPGVVRHPVQRLLPAAAADPGRADRARGRVRVPGQGRQRPLAAPLGPARSSVGSLVPALLWGVAFGNIVRGVPLDADHEYAGDAARPAQPVRAARRADTLLLFTTARRGLPRAEDRRATVPGRRPRASAGRIAVGVVAGCVSCSGPSSAHGSPARPLAVAWPSLVGALAHVAGREGWAFLAHRHRRSCSPSPRCSSRCTRTCCRPPRRRVQPDRRRTPPSTPVHAEDHDVGRGGLHPAGPALPGLDLLGVPPADLRVEHIPAAATRRPREDRSTRGCCGTPAPPGRTWPPAVALGVAGGRAGRRAGDAAGRRRSAGFLDGAGS